MGEAFLTPEQEVHYRSGIIFLCDDIWSQFTLESEKKWLLVSGKSVFSS